MKEHLDRAAKRLDDFERFLDSHEAALNRKLAKSEEISAEFEIVARKLMADVGVLRKQYKRERRVAMRKDSGFKTNELDAMKKNADAIEKVVNEAAAVMAAPVMKNTVAVELKRIAGLRKQNGELRHLIEDTRALGDQVVGLDIDNRFVRLERYAEREAALRSARVR